jgi:HlyD family secretion protein
MRTLVIILVVIGAAAAGAAYYVQHANSEPVAAYRTVPIERGDLLSTISATGTIEPERAIDVGAQVMGVIQELGVDPKDPTKTVDYCTEVEEGAVLARIDPKTYQAALEQAEASLQRSKADLLQLEAKYEQAKQEWKRAQALRPLKALSDTEYDAAVANYKAAEANISVGKATIRQNEAALTVAKTNLGYTTITSPIRGTIIDRRVDVGQTVVASLNAPSLFLIGKDLRRVQVWASVNEADIGQIRLGMTAHFTVDTHPGEKFVGKVTQIRLNAQMTQNIVTYTVIVTTDNVDGRLLLYLTANVQFEVDHRKDVLLVPNAALRWRPSASQVDPAAGELDATAADSDGSLQHGSLWVEAGGGLVRPVDVLVLATDGTLTEVSGEGVKEGMWVVVADADAGGSAGADSAADETKNPFLPKLPRGPRRRGAM